MTAAEFYEYQTNMRFEVWPVNYTEVNQPLPWPLQSSKSSLYLKTQNMNIIGGESGPFFSKVKI